MVTLAVIRVFSIIFCLGKATAEKTARLENRVVGGRDTDISEVAYQLSLEYGGDHTCGATIISSDWILTAAHCVHHTYGKNIRFRAGSSLRGTGGSLHYAIKMVVHPQYNSNTDNFDVAVIQVSPPFIMNENVKTITLSSVEPKAGDVASVSGWGFFNCKNRTLATQLQSVTVPIVDRDECNRIHNGQLDDNMLCAGYKTGGKDACTRDSGGPLVTGGILAGIVASGVGCGNKNCPGVYTSVSKMKAFITKYTDAVFES